MNIVKYIINSSGKPILFRTDILHSDIENSVLSAGFAIIDYDVLIDQFIVKCYGGSESLGINANKNDCLIIQNYLNNLLYNSDFSSVSDILNSKMVFKGSE